MSLSILPLTIKNFQQLLAIEQQDEFPWPEGVLRDCFLMHDEIYGVQWNDKIIAYAVMRLLLEEGELLNIITDKAFRSQGYGKALLKHLLSIAQQQNIKKIYLEVRVSNSAAIDLYAKLGFKKIGLRKNYYPAKEGREDASILALDLKELPPIH